MLHYARILFVVTSFLLLSPGNQVAAERLNVAKSPNAICPILVGSQIPEITLQDLDGKSFELNKALARKPTILIYFRGGW